MTVVRSPRRLDVRFCLCCGHDGPELQAPEHEAVFFCELCGADLYARPPRSYRELEGLDELESAAPRKRAGLLGRIVGRLSRLLTRRGGSVRAVYH